MARRPRSRPPARPRVRLYPIVAKAVEDGCARGVRRLWKYRSELRESEAEAYADEIAREVMNEVCEVLDFGD